MHGEGSLFDVPPAAFGRFRALHQLGAGAYGPIFQGEDSETHDPVVITAFGTGLGAERAHEVAQGLFGLVAALPVHAAIAVPLAAGLDETEPYFVARFVAGESLDVALRDYGPAAIVDLVPRLRLLAEALDLAAQHEIVHGTLHPRDILVSPECTVLTGIGVAPLLAQAGVALQVRRPYTAPEVAKSGTPSPAGDQFSLAAITFEWLFGRRIAGPADAALTVPALSGVDREALSSALTSALASEPGARFESCRLFCDAVSASVIEAARSRGSAEKPARRPASIVPASLPLGEEEPEVEERPPLALDSLDAVPLAPPEPVVGWQPSLPAPPRQPEQWSNGAMVASLVVGLIFGFAAGYMAVPRALQQYQPRTVSEAGNRAPGTGNRAPGTGNREAGAGTRDVAPDAPGAPEAPVAPAPEAREAPVAPVAPGRLLIRSTPSGAAVQVDGVSRGVTPLALRDLELGARTVVLTRRGFVADERRVVLTKARPSRSLEVRLSAEVPAVSPRGGAVARPAAGRAAAATGSLLVDSRPPGASVTIDGRPFGVTPLTVGALPPGEHAIRITLAGYRPFTTTVRVVAGERTRAAASLIGAQEYE